MSADLAFRILVVVVFLIPIAMVLIVLCGRMNEQPEEPEEIVIGDVPRSPE